MENTSDITLHDIGPEHEKRARDTVRLFYANEASRAGRPIDLGGLNTMLDTLGLVSSDEPVMFGE